MNPTLLFRALTLNGLFSGFSALFMFIASGWLAAQLGLASPVAIYVVGGGLALFALQLVNIVRTREIRIWEITGIIGGDIAWVIASIIGMALYHGSMTRTGLLLVDIVAALVLLFAIMQMLGLKQYLQQTGRQGSPSL